MSSGGRGLRWAGRALAVVGLVLAVLAVRVVTSSRAELEEGDRLRALGENEAAVVHYRRAGRWYAPGNPYCVEALGRLASVAAEAEQLGERERALSAWRAVRGVILSTRGFTTPHQDRLRDADERIADLVSVLPRPVMEASKTREEVRAAHLALLRQEVGPDPLWTATLLFGFFLWVGSAFGLAQRGIDAQGRIQRAPATRWGGALVVGFALWIVGMVLA